MSVIGVHDVAIIGGGIAGLYANYLLTNKKHNCIVLEKIRPCLEE